MLRIHHLILPMLILCLAPALTVPRSGIAAQPAIRSGGAAPSPAAAWHTIITSDFAANRPGVWPQGNRGRFNEHVDHGRYTVSVAPGISRFEAPGNIVAVGDGQIVATVRTSGGGGAGVAARIDPAAQTAYAFWIDNTGTAIGLRQAYGERTLLFSIHSESIIPGGDNTIALRIEGARITFAINGQQISSYDDAHPLPPGVWGIFVASTWGAAQGSYAHIDLVGEATAPLLPTGPYEPLFDTDFSFGDGHDWYVGNYIKANTTVANGQLTISVVNGFSQFDWPKFERPYGNGQIAAIVRPEGRGRAGVMGRWKRLTGGNSALYSFWITNGGVVGASRWVGANVIDLFALHSTRVQPNHDNVLVLRIQGTRLSFYLNDALVHTQEERQPLDPGYWGAFVSSAKGDGPTQGHYRHILIAA